MTDSQHIAQLLYSPDPSNVLIGVELYKQQDTETQQCVIDAFLEELERVRFEENLKTKRVFDFGTLFISSFSEFKHIVSNDKFVFVLEYIDYNFTICFFGIESQPKNLTPENFLLLFNP